MSEKFLDIKKRLKGKHGKNRVRYFCLQDKEWIKREYLTLKKDIVQIAEELGCVNSTVYFALVRFDIPIDQSRKGGIFSKEHLEKITKANRAKAKKGSAHWNWQGGKEDSCHPRHSWQWKEWRKKVYERDKYTCRGCNYKKGRTLNPHHILPVRDFPHLKYDVINGITLCKKCHEKTMNREYHYITIFRTIIKGGELLETPERTISSQARVGIPLKVQRPEAESRTDSNASTSAVHESDDMVCSLSEDKEVWDK